MLEGGNCYGEPLCLSWWQRQVDRWGSACFIKSETQWHKKCLFVVTYRGVPDWAKREGLLMDSGFGYWALAGTGLPSPCPLAYTILKGCLSFLGEQVHDNPLMPTWLSIHLITGVIYYTSRRCVSHWRPMGWSYSLRSVSTDDSWGSWDITVFGNWGCS